MGATMQSIVLTIGKDEIAEQPGPKALPK